MYFQNRVQDSKMLNYILLNAQLSYLNGHYRVFLHILYPKSTNHIQQHPIEMVIIRQSL